MIPMSDDRISYLEERLAKRMDDRRKAWQRIRKANEKIIEINKDLHSIRDQLRRREHSDKKKI